MWEHRNNIVHETFEETLNKKTSELVKKELITQYRKGSNRIIRQHCYLFQENLHILLEKPVSKKYIG